MTELLQNVDESRLGPSDLAHFQRPGTERPTRQVTQIVVSDWCPLRKADSLQGFLTLTLPSGIVIHDCTWHKRDDGACWIGLPAWQYQKADGSTAWARIVDFADCEAQRRFQKFAKEAVERYFAALGARAGVERCRDDERTRSTTAPTAWPDSREPMAIRGASDESGR